MRAFVLLGLLAAHLAAQPVPPEQLDVMETDAFAALLHYQGLEVVSVDRAFRKPNATVLVIVGKPPEGSNLRTLSELGLRCLAQGGALLIATDQPLDVTPFFPEPRQRVAIDGKMVFDAFESYNGVPDLPFLVFPPSLDFPEQDLASIARLKRVATNNPSFLNHQGDAVAAEFGTFSPTARVPKSGRPPGTAMAVCPLKTGTGVVLADAGILATQWIAGRHLPPVDNADFAIHLAKYLVTGPNRTRKRTQCVYCANGVLKERLDRALLSPGMPEIRPPWDAIQKTIADNVDRKAIELQDRDFPNRNLLDAVSFRTIMQRILTLVAIVGAIYLLRRLRGAKVEENVPAKQIPEAIAGETDELSVSGNFAEVAKERVRLQWAAWGFPESRCLPAVAVDGPWLYRKRMEKSLRRFWMIAFGSQPLRISSKQWRALENRISEFDDQIRTGHLRVAESAA